MFMFYASISFENGSKSQLHPTPFLTMPYKILFVLTSHAKVEGTGEETGWSVKSIYYGPSTFKL
jgi:hypothetical protein